MRGVTAVVNLIGILNERGRETFASIHAEAAREVVDALHRAPASRGSYT